MINIVPLSEMKIAEYVALLYYGPKGAGKTYFCGTAGPRVFYINIGLGLDTILSEGFKKKYYPDGKYPLVTTIREDREKGKFDAANAFDDVCDAIDEALAKYGDAFDTVVIDDATALKAFARLKGLFLSDDLNKSKTLKNARDSGFIIPGIQDYGMEINLLDQFINGTIALCKDNNKNLILTAHERLEYKPEKDVTTGRNKMGEKVLNKIRPGFIGQTSPEDMTANFDLVFHAEVVSTGKGPVYRCKTVGDEMLIASNRYPGKLDSTIKDPNFLEILKLIRS